MVFFVVAAALPQNNEQSNFEHLERSMVVNGRKVADCHIVKVRKMTPFSDLQKYINSQYMLNQLFSIGREAKIQDWHSRQLNGAQ